MAHDYWRVRSLKATAPLTLLRMSSTLKPWNYDFAQGGIFATDGSSPWGTANRIYVKARLAAKNVFFLAQRPGPDPAIQLFYFSARAWDAAGAPAGAALHFELTFKQGVPAIKVVAKSALPEPFTKLACAAVKAALAR